MTLRVHGLGGGFSRERGFDFMKFHERFDWGQMIDVDFHDSVSNGLQRRIVELKKTHLNSLIWHRDL